MELIIIALIGMLIFGIPAVILFVVFLNRRSPGKRTQYGRIQCPECGESIVAEAIKCRFCGAKFDETSTDAPDDATADTDSKN